MLITDGRTGREERSSVSITVALGAAGALVIILTFLSDKIDAVMLILLLTAGFHYIIYSRSSSVPMIFPLLLLLPTLPLLAFDESIGSAAYVLLAGMSLGYSMDLRVSPITVLPVLFAVGILIHIYLFDVIPNADAKLYFAQLENESSLLNFLTDRGQSLLENPKYIFRSVYWFPVVFAPLYYVFDLTGPEAIIIVNAILWFGTALLTRELVDTHFRDEPHHSGNVVFALLVLSPSAMYWTANFNKDIAATFFPILVTYLFLRKRYPLAGLALLFATGIRPYAVAIVCIYVAVFLRSYRVLLLGVLGSVATVVIVAGTPLPLPTTVLVLPYLFLSPVPIDLSNWLTSTVTLRTLEGVLIGGVFAASWLLMSKRAYRREFVLLGLGVAIYALVMVLVGYHNTLANGDVYTLFTVGDNVLRKKMSLLPLILIWVGFTLQAIRAKTPLPDIELRY